MRKRVFKRKKETFVKSKIKSAAKAVAFAAAVTLMLGTVMTAYGEEMGDETSPAVLKTVVTDIFHRHIGSPDVEGGCYTNPISHEHQGDAINGGGCYTKPIPHSHTGSPETGGGCYGKEIPHIEHGSECYITEDHTHVSACLSGRCTITYTETGVLDTYTDNCYIHGETAHDRRSAIASHSECGQGEVDAVREVCKSCTDSLTRTHPYLNCGKQEGSTAVLMCTKTIDGYEINCGYDEGAAEYYERECGDKTADSYGLGCGLKEEKPCGRLILTSQAGSDSAKVIISARLEDLSGGKLILSDDPYIWRDQEGNLLGSGESLEVDKNGDYSVTVSLENKDVDESGLRSSILVDNICKEEQETPTATPSASIAPTATPSATPAATVSPAPVAVPDKSPTPEPSNVPEINPDKGDKEEGNDTDEDKEEEKGDGTVNEEHGDGNSKGSGDGGAAVEASSKANLPENMSNHGNDGSGNSSRRLSYYEKRDQSQTENIDVPVSPSPEPKEKLKKDTTAVTVSGNNAAEEREYKVGQQTRKSHFFQSKAVKIITITISTLLILAGIALLLLYLMCSVRVYNDDGQGRMIYLGRCLVKKMDEEYSLVITEAMTERSCTNRYCIKPGLFRLGKKEDQELIVYRDDKKAVVYLDKEMIVII